MSFWGGVGRGVTLGMWDPDAGGKGPFDMTRGTQWAQIDPSGGLEHNAYQSNQFAGAAEGGYGAMTREMAKDRSFLRDLASGKNSVAGEQLRQGMQQNIAGQQAMAASAAPGNQAMAARNASMNAARVGSGLAGQQAVAGLQERQMAGQQLAAMNQAQRGQDINAALGARGNAITGYGALEQARTSRYAADMGVPSSGERFLGAAQGFMSAAAMSDENKKEGVKSGGKEARTFMDALNAKAYWYKDPKYGKGKQVGVMAQDLEKSPMGKQAVVDTPQGKVVHSGKLATAVAAGLADVNKRLEKVEGKKPRIYEVSADYPDNEPVRLSGGRPGIPKSYEAAKDRPQVEYQVQASYPAGMVARLSGGKPGRPKSYEGPVAAPVPGSDPRFRLPFSKDPQIKLHEIAEEESEIFNDPSPAAQARREELRRMKLEIHQQLSTSQAEPSGAVRGSFQSALMR